VSHETSIKIFLKRGGIYFIRRQSAFFVKKMHFASRPSKFMVKRLHFDLIYTDQNVHFFQRLITWSAIVITCRQSHDKKTL